MQPRGKLNILEIWNLATTNPINDATVATDDNEKKPIATETIEKYISQNWHVLNYVDDAGKNILHHLAENAGDDGYTNVLISNLLSDLNNPYPTAFFAADANGKTPIDIARDRNNQQFLAGVKGALDDVLQMNLGSAPKYIPYLNMRERLKNPSKTAIPVTIKPTKLLDPNIVATNAEPTPISHAAKLDALRKGYISIDTEQTRKLIAALKILANDVPPGLSYPKITLSADKHRFGTTEVNSLTAASIHDVIHYLVDPLGHQSYEATNAQAILDALAQYAAKEQQNLTASPVAPEITNSPPVSPQPRVVDEIYLDILYMQSFLGGMIISSDDVKTLLDNINNKTVTDELIKRPKLANEFCKAAMNNESLAATLLTEKNRYFFNQIIRSPSVLKEMESSSHFVEMLSAISGESLVQTKNNKTPPYRFPLEYLREDYFPELYYSLDELKALDKPDAAKVRTGVALVKELARVSYFSFQDNAARLFDSKRQIMLAEKILSNSTSGKEQKEKAKKQITVITKSLEALAKTDYLPAEIALAELKLSANALDQKGIAQLKKCWEKTEKSGDKDSQAYISWIIKKFSAQNPSLKSIPMSKTQMLLQSNTLISGMTSAVDSKTSQATKNKLNDIAKLLTKTVSDEIKKYGIANFDKLSRVCHAVLKLLQERNSAYLFKTNALVTLLKGYQKYTADQVILKIDALAEPHRKIADKYDETYDTEFSKLDALEKRLSAIESKGKHNFTPDDERLYNGLKLQRDAILFEGLLKHQRKDAPNDIITLAEAKSVINSMSGDSRQHPLRDHLMKILLRPNQPVATIALELANEFEKFRNTNLAEAIARGAIDKNRGMNFYNKIGSFLAHVDKSYAEIWEKSQQKRQHTPQVYSLLPANAAHATPAPTPGPTAHTVVITDIEIKPSSPAQLLSREDETNSPTSPQPKTDQNTHVETNHHENQDEEGEGDGENPHTPPPRPR